MANLPTKVQPGDLITSDLMNAFLEKCRDIETRLRQLEVIAPGDTKVVIFSPVVTQVYRIGEELRVVGRNFGTPAENTVFIDTSVQVSQFKLGSNDQLLIFDIPFVQNIPVSGRAVTLTVSNPRGFATTSFILAQPVATKPTGSLTVTRTGSPSGDLDPGSDYVFTYRITAATTLEEVYDVNAAVDLGWRARLVDSRDQPIVPQQVFIPKPQFPTVPEVVTIRIQVTIPGSAQVGETGILTVTVSSTRNPSGLTKTSEPTPLPVGDQAAPGDQIGVSLTSVFAPATLVDGTIVIPPPAAGSTTRTAFATFKAEVPAAGDYTIPRPTFNNDPSGLWSATVVGGGSGVFMQPPQATFNVQITGTTGAPEAQMVVQVISDDNATVTGDIEQPLRFG
jgi:hypothetical protein